MDLKMIRPGMKVTRLLCRALRTRSQPGRVVAVEEPHDVYVEEDGELFRRHPLDLEPA